MAEYDIVAREPQRYAAIGVTVSMDDMVTVVPPLNSEVFGWLAARGAAPSGPPFWKYNTINMPGALTIEAGVAIDGAAEGDDRVRIAELPGGSYLQTMYHGHPDGLMQATGDLLDYAAERGLRFDSADGPDGEVWAARLELYQTDPADEPDMNNWDTTLAFKLAD